MLSATYHPRPAIPGKFWVLVEGRNGTSALYLTSGYRYQNHDEALDQAKLLAKEDIQIFVAEVTLMVIQPPPLPLPNPVVHQLL